jgi:prepilin-type N-terminal cleavage/methylation domain-containing protein
MSQSRPISRLRRDGGFTLIELTVAMLIFGVAVISTTPLLLGGLNAGRAAKLNLQAKALGQERLEQMRNLPFHVDHANGVYIDLLDMYYRDLQPTGAALPPPAPPDKCSLRTYVAGTYSCTISSATLGYPYTGFTQVVQSQFLTASRTLVIPPSTYDSQVSGYDAPASNLLSVVITTKWKDAGKQKSYVVRSQISNAQAPASTIETNLQASALTLNSNTTDGQVLHFEGGTLAAGGSLNDGSTVNAAATGAAAQISSGSKVAGATFGASLPGPAPTAPTAGSAQLLLGDCNLACFASSSITPTTPLVSITNGLHQVGSATANIVSQLNRDGTGAGGSFQFGTGAPSTLDPSLSIVGSPVNGPTSGNLSMKTAGYLDTTGSGSTAVTVTATSTLPLVSLFSTTLAPAGLVQIQDVTASLTCATGGGTGSVTPSWSGTLKYFGSDNTYHSLTLAPGASALPAPSTIPVAGGQLLSHWISSWSEASSASARVEEDRTAKGDLPGVLNILTVPTRAGDDTSPIELSVAPMSCLAVDNR